jgi:hypothetical protein
MSCTAGLSTMFFPPRHLFILTSILKPLVFFHLTFIFLLSTFSFKSHRIIFDFNLVQFSCIWY